MYSLQYKHSTTEEFLVQLITMMERTQADLQKQYCLQDPDVSAHVVTLFQGNLKLLFLCDLSLLTCYTPVFEETVL